MRGTLADRPTYLRRQPFYEPNNYPGTGISNEQQARMGAALRSKLDAAGLQDTRILVLDHNWDLYKNVSGLLMASLALC
jgi:hypothetical protein